MATEFKLPELGENVEGGDVVRVMVSVGDTLQKDQPVLEIETDKATIEVPSNVSGVVKEIHIKEGEQAKVGQTILTLEASNGQSEPVTAKPEVQPAPEAQPEPEAKARPETTEPAQPATTTPTQPRLAEFVLPELGENVPGGDVVNVMVAVGDTLKKDQPVLEIETDKATIEVPSTMGGLVKEVHIKAGDRAEVGQKILTLESTDSQPQPAAKPEPQPEAKAAPETKPEPEPAPAPKPVPVPPPSPDQPRKIAPAAPSVRRLARELGIDINQVPGTGPGGRISDKDVKAYVKKLNTERPAAPVAGGAVAPPPLPDFSKWGEVERERMSSIRRATAKQMEIAWTNVAHVTNFDKADITGLEQLRQQFGKRAEAAGGKLTVTVILLKVLATALKRFPKLNASIDMANQEVIYKKYYHIGVAVDTDRGLLVPSIRNVDQKSILQLSVELNEVAAKARDKKLTLEEMQGSTFTLTNLGGIGGTNFTPIVNHPEVAILGVSRASTEAVYRDGTFEPRLMMPLALSYDHRLIDGADAARFLRWVVEALEQPFLLSLEG